MEINFITTNKLKFEIAHNLLKKYGIKVIQRYYEFDEVQSLSVEEVAVNKAKQYMNLTKKPFMVSDDGFSINALNGFPGALLKPVMSTIGDKKLLDTLNGEKNRSAVFINALAFADPKNKLLKSFLTRTNGKIPFKPMGSGDFGWSIGRIFIADGWEKTLSQLNQKERDIFWKHYSSNLPYIKLAKWLIKTKQINSVE
jgi:non-canonical purine NTP pyrophosphatase (RdgB/HAM1 family)